MRTLKALVLFWLTLVALGLMVVLCAAQQFAMVDPGQATLNGLIGWWRALPGFTGGNTFYNVTGSGHGTLNNMGFSTTSGWSPSTRRSGFMQLNFDGLDDRVTVGGTGDYNFLDTTWTAMLWYRATVAGHLLGKRVPTGGYFLRLDAGGTVTARIVDTNDLAAGQRSTVSTNHLDGTWRHLAVVWVVNSVTVSANDVTIYINGVVDQGARTDSAANAAGACACILTFGAQSDSTAFLTGAEDDIRFYNRGLSATEITAIYQLGLGGDVGLFTTPAQVVFQPGGVTSGSFFPFFR